jgi:hypothetical protein
MHSKQTPNRGAEYDGARDMDAFWAAAKPESEPTRRRWYVPALVGLVVASVPWYREAGVLGDLFFGMPGWVWVSLLCTAGVSALTAIGLLRYWRDGD